MTEVCLGINYVIVLPVFVEMCFKGDVTIPLGIILHVLMEDFTGLIVDGQTVMSLVRGIIN